MNRDRIAAHARLSTVVLFRACPPSCLTRAGVHRLMGTHTQKAQKHHTNTRHETHESAPPLHLSLSTSRHPELIQTAFGRDGG